MMNSQNNSEKNSCCCPSSGNEQSKLSQLSPIPMAQSNHEADDAPCCGPKQGPPASPYEKPGYRLCRFVDGFIDSKLGPVPRLRNSLGWFDYFGIMRARAGVLRDQYKVAPGLYCFGTPDQDSPVLVSANYKLTIDALRKDTAGLDAWLLVLDTRGVNVWCAAGKKNFSSAEIIRQVQRVQLHNLVRHRQLIVPQLGAPGVAAHLVQKGCGFKVLWGPIKSTDIKRYVANGNAVDGPMRSVTFTIGERMVLVPVEIYLVLKPSLAIIAALFVLSGFCPDFFSLDLALRRGAVIAAAYGMGVFAGAVAVPALLPWIFFRSFYLKGILVGLAFGLLLSELLIANLIIYDKVALLLICCAVSSYAAMNYTGTTPYTSPSGVEKEMRRGIPFQLLATIIAVILWVWGGFFG